MKSKGGSPPCSSFYQKVKGVFDLGVKIHVPADEVWSFFQKNKDRLSEEMVLIAENEETEYSLYLTEEDGLPLFSMCKGDDEPEYEEGAINEKDCADTAKQCCVKYLMPVIVNSSKGYGGVWNEEEDDIPFSYRDEQEEIIENREWELLFAMADFIITATKDNTCSDGSDYIDTYGADLVQEILDEVLQKLAEEYGLSIYRPMMVNDDETGGDMLIEYPYNDPADFEDDME